MFSLAQARELASRRERRRCVAERERCGRPGGTDAGMSPVVVKPAVYKGICGTGLRYYPARRWNRLFPGLVHDPQRRAIGELNGYTEKGR